MGGKHREYHNLRGVVRDVQRALREGDYEEVFALLDILDDVEDARDGVESDTGLAETDDPAAGESVAQLDLPDCGDSGEVRGPAPGHGPGSDPPVGGSSRMEPALGHQRASVLASGAIKPRVTAPVVRATRTRGGLNRA